MRFEKRSILLLIFALFVAMPVFGQRFTKKEQALREARAKNFFYGHSFTISAGYVHSWLTTDKFEENIFGRTGQYSNTRESFEGFFSWDICTNRRWGVQFSAGYTQLGGQKLIYQDQGLGYGPQLRPDLIETIHINEVDARILARWFFPLTYKSRLSLNAGPNVSRVVGKYTNCNDWDFGCVVGLGYDWNHWSFGINYKPGVFPSIIKGSDTRAASISFNAGFRLWK